MLKIVLPANMDTTLEHLKLAKREVSFPVGGDVGRVESTGDWIVRLRSSDIPVEVDDSCDVGLCGSDWVIERNLELGRGLEILDRYHYGRIFLSSPSLDLVVPQREEIGSVEGIKPGTFILTEYPYITKRFLKECGLKASRLGDPSTPKSTDEFRRWCKDTGRVGIRIVHGRIGALVALGAGYGVMVNETGKAREENELKILERIHEIETMLIADQDALEKRDLGSKIHSLKKDLHEAYEHYLAGESEATTRFFKERAI